MTTAYLFVNGIDQRKGILLDNTKEEEEDCIQYGPRYLWWFLQSTTANANANADKTILAVSVSNAMSQTSMSDHNDSALALVADILLAHKIVIGNQSQLNTDKMRPNETLDQLKMSLLGMST